MTTKYTLSALGGTFDHLHKGHQTLINYSLKISQQIIIGITNDRLITHKQLSQLIQPFSKRKKNVQEYLSQQNINQNRIKLIELNDIFGPTLTNLDIDCLITSPLTKIGAEKINKERYKKKLPKLPIKVCKLEKDINNKYISSSRVRAGEINREGFVYANILTKDIILNNKQRTRLKTPLGDLITNNKRRYLNNYLTEENPPRTIAIGDETSLYCYNNKLKIDLYVFDNHIKRQKIETSIQQFISPANIVTVENPAGSISQRLSQALIQNIYSPMEIKIKGEEDLAVLPAILITPLNSIILYGQPDKGLVMVKVTEDKKEWVNNLLRS